LDVFIIQTQRVLWVLSKSAAQWLGPRPNSTLLRIHEIHIK
jgi:hypothetical protein